MSLFQSGPYQSRVVGGVVRWVRHWLDQGAIAGRRLRTLTSWTAQILLFPVYLGFQAGRGLRARLEFLLESGSSKFPTSPSEALVLEISSEITGLDGVGLDAEPTVSPTWVDLPVYRVLQTIQALRLPPLSQTEVELEDPWISPLPATTDASESGAMVTTAPASLVQSPLPPHRKISKISWLSNQIGTIFSKTASLDLMPIDLTIASNRGLQPETVQHVRGIASRLDTRSLVLVTPHNQILDILSPEQQAQLQRRMVAESAALHRSLRLRQERVRAWLRAYGPIQALPGIRGWGQRLLGWVQHSPVAISVNLFEEALLLPGTPTGQWLVALGYRCGGSRDLVLGTSAEGAVIAPASSQPSPDRLTALQLRRLVQGGAQVDLPVCLILQTVQAWELPVVPSLHSLDFPRTEYGKIAPAAAATDFWSMPEPLPQSLEPFSGLAQMAPRLGNIVQGIACCIATRSLVLVTPENQILDILSPEQQEHLRRQIVVMVATYGRAVKLQKQPRTWLRTTPSWLSPESEPFQGQKLLDWVWKTASAIGDRLLPAARQSSVSPASPALPFWVPPTPMDLSPWSLNMAIGPVDEKRGLGAAAASVVLSAAALVPSQIPYPPPLQIQGTAQSTPTPIASYPLSAPGNSSMQPAVVTEPALSSVISDWNHAISDLNEATPNDIDTHVSGVHYLRSPWERFLRWLDRVFLWIETNLSRLWNAR